MFGVALLKQLLTVFVGVSLLVVEGVAYLVQGVVCLQTVVLGETGPMAYAFYKKMPDSLIYQAMKMLPDWMVDVSERFDEIVNSKTI